MSIQAPRHPISGFFFVLGLVGLALFASSSALAQKITVSYFVGPAAHEFSPPGHEAIRQALAEGGIETVPIENYLSQAVDDGIAPPVATEPENVAVLSAKLGLFGVITGSTISKEGAKKDDVGLTVLDANGLPMSEMQTELSLIMIAFTGRPVLEKKYTFSGGARIPLHVREAIARDVKAVLAGRGVQAEESEGKRSGPSSPRERSSRTSKSSPDDALDKPGSPEIETEAKAKSSREERTRAPGAISDVSVTGGFTLNARKGLDPTHASNLFPGARADAHFFLGALTTLPVIRDLGVAGMFNQGLGLSYGAKNGQASWGANHYEWRAEVLLRLALREDIKLNPAFVLRYGLGSLTSTIDAPANVPRARSVSYLRPSAGMDLYLNLIRPYLRLRVGGAHLFKVQVGEELTGDASGFFLNSSLDLVILRLMQLSLGWEMTRLTLRDEGSKKAPPMGETYDMFHCFYFRLGGSFDRK
jgi:hypothetical protein